MKKRDYAEIRIGPSTTITAALSQKPYCAELQGVPIKISAAGATPEEALGHLLKTHCTTIFQVLAEVFVTGPFGDKRDITKLSDSELGAFVMAFPQLFRLHITR